MNRNLILYGFLIAVTVLAGLASRHYSSILPAWINLYLGDALWALMVFFVAGFVFRLKSTLWISILALSFSFTVEISQLYHASWIDAIRVTKLGGLVLGFGFLWSDLVCYFTGICTGACIEIIIKSSAKAKRV